MENKIINKKMRYNKIFKNILSLLILVLCLFSVSYADGLSTGSDPVAAGLADPVVISPISTAPSAGPSSISIASCEGLFANGLDPTRNLMSSIISLCLPGILVNLDKLEQNQCQKILCEYDMAQKGLTPILCAKEAAYNTCLITGEGYDVIEGILIGSLRQNIRQILENPLGLGIQYIKNQLELAEKGLPCTGPFCTVPQKVRNIILGGFNIAEAIGQIQSLASQLEGLLGGEEQKTACEQLEDIRPELEEIVDQYYEVNGR